MHERPKRESVSRREALTAMFSLGTGLLFKTPVAQALDKLFTEHGMKLPNVEDREATREHFFRNKHVFENVLSHPAVLEILNTPIDENLTPDHFRAIEEIMSILLSNWPTSYGKHVLHLPEYNPVAWFGHFPSEFVTVKNVKSGKKFIGNATRLPDGTSLTAGHLLKDTAIPHKRSKDPHADIAVFTPNKAIVTGASIAIKPVHYPPEQLRGKIVSIAGYNANLDPHGYIDTAQKVYVSGVIPITDVMGLYLYFHSRPDSKSSQVKNYTSFMSGNNSMNAFLATVGSNYRILFRNLILLPAGETLGTTSTTSADNTDGMSGSGLLIHDKETKMTEVVGVFTHGIELYDPVRRVCFSTAQCCTDIADVVQATK